MFAQVSRSRTFTTTRWYAFVLVLALVMATVGGTPAVAAEVWAINLGYLDTSFYTHAEAINDRGQIVGRSLAWLNGNEEEGDTAHAFLWEKGSMTNLGRFYPSAINNRSQIVGYGHNATEAYPGYHGFLWENGTLTDLGVFFPQAINNRGQIVGNRGQIAGGSLVWENGTLTDLGSLGGGGTSAEDINDRGQVVGRSRTAAGIMHGFLWENGTMTDLGSFWPTAINNHGQMVGGSFLWENGTLTDIGVGAEDINDRGQVVGQSDQHAFLWSAQRGLVDLHIPIGHRYNRSWAMAINNRGQIVGYSDYRGDDDHGMLWTIEHD